MLLFEIVNRFFWHHIALSGAGKGTHEIRKNLMGQFYLTMNFDELMTEMCFARTGQLSGCFVLYVTFRHR